MQGFSPGIKKITTIHKTVTLIGSDNNIDSYHTIFELVRLLRLISYGFMNWLCCYDWYFIEFLFLLFGVYTSNNSWLVFWHRSWSFPHMFQVLIWRYDSICPIILYGFLLISKEIIFPKIISNEQYFSPETISVTNQNIIKDMAISTIY